MTKSIQEITVFIAIALFVGFFTAYPLVGELPLMSVVKTPAHKFRMTKAEQH